jgi:putative heme-binding domain-containing protein
MLQVRITAIVLLLAGSARSADKPLQEQLAAEPVADLTKAVRERGDAGRGAILFFQPFLSCAQCHDGEAQLGPDIAKAGKEATAKHLVESVLFPSKVVKKGYETVVVTTRDERTVSGLLVMETAESLTLLDPAANGKRVTIGKSEIEKRLVGKQSMMPEGLINTLSDRQQFLDLAKYLIEVAEGGPVRARELRPAVTAAVIPEYEKDIDHAGLIRAWDDKSLRRGEVIYTRVCANCHGTKEQLGSLPTSPRTSSRTAAIRSACTRH